LLIKLGLPEHEAGLEKIGASSPKLLDLWFVSLLQD